MIRQASLDATLSSTLFAEQTLPTRPSFSPRLLVWLFCIRSFAGAHEAVASAIIAHDVVGLAGGLHLRDGVGDHGADARVVPCIKAVDRSFNAHQGIPIRRRTIKNKSGRQIGMPWCALKLRSTAFMQGTTRAS